MNMKQYAYIMIALISMNLHTMQSFTVEPIESVNLYEHRELYQRFIQHYCSLCPCDIFSSQAIEHQFDQEEIDYQYHNPTTLFFHAKIQDTVIGYISCDIASNNMIMIRQIVFDPTMFDAILVKELLFAIFSQFPQTKKITLHCLATCDDLKDLLGDIGFSQVKPASLDDIYYQYELHLSSKCKVCEVLYNKDFWLQPSDEDDGYEDESE